MTHIYTMILCVYYDDYVTYFVVLFLFSVAYTYVQYKLYMYVAVLYVCCTYLCKIILNLNNLF